MRGILNYFFGLIDDPVREAGQRIMNAEILTRFLSKYRPGNSLSALLGCLLLFGCTQPLPTYRYRLSVIVDTPEGRRAGSSVVEIRSHLNPGLLGPDADGVSSSQIGEAVAVALPGDKYLFAVMKWKSPEYRFVEMLNDSFADQLAAQRTRMAAKGDNESLAALVRAISKLRGIRPVPQSQYPLLVYFRNRANPRTVETVEPAALNAVFGPGYRMVGLTVQITNDPVTRKIQGILPWVKSGEYQFLDQSTRGKLYSDTTDAQGLAHRDFQQGIKNGQ